MSRFTRVAALALATCVALPAVAQPYNSELVGFNGPPVDDVTAREMFQTPQTSGSTAGYITANATATSYDQNYAYRASGFQTEGDGALGVKFRWVNPADADRWVRLTTFNGPARPNPALHVDGKVRFKLYNLSELFAGTIGVCLGVRETNVDVRQLADGGVSGEIEWVGTSTVPNGMLAGADQIVDTDPNGDDEQFYSVGTDLAGLSLSPDTVIIGPGLNGVMNTTPAGDDTLRRGYFLSANGARRPIPAVTLAPFSGAYALEFDLTDGSVTIDGSPVANAGISGFTGNGDLTTPTGRGVLEHIAITGVSGDSAVTIEFYLDELQFESPVADTVPAPFVVEPVVAGATSIQVSGVIATASEVILYRDGSPLPSQFPTPPAPATVTFTLAPPGAQAGEIYSAAQRDGSSGVLGPQSPGVLVCTLAPPPAPTVRLPILAGDSSVTLDGVNAAATDVTVFEGNNVIGTAPTGGAATVIVPLSSPLEHLQQITATAANVCEGARSTPVREVGKGNGDVWLTLGIRETGAAVGTPIFANAGTANGIEFLGAANVVPGSAPINAKLISPSTSWQTVTFTPGSDPVRAFAGGTADGTLSSATGLGAIEMLAVSVISTSPGRSVGVYTIYVDNIVNVAAGPGGVDAVMDFESYAVGNTVMFRAPNFSGSTPAHLIGALSGTAGTITTEQGNSGKSVKLSMYFVDTNNTPQRWVRITTFNSAILGNPCIDLTKPIKMDILLPPQLPPAPRVNAPLVDGDVSVTVSQIHPDASLVDVLVNNAVVATVDPSGAPTFDVDVPELDQYDIVTARQTTPLGTSPNAGTLEVGAGNSGIYLCIGIRETGDIGALGSEGSATLGAIEWVGADSLVAGAPIGTLITPSESWQHLVFDPATATIRSFSAGDNAITGTRGTLEHLAVTLDDAAVDASSGPFTLYVDNVVNRNADGGPDFLISDFESFAVNAEALFQEPTFSGSTDFNLANTYTDSGVSDAEGNPGQSARLDWFFVDSSPGRWIRITTSGAANLSRPIIDITKPIEMDVLLLPAAPPLVPGDVDGDGDVDLTDLARLLANFGLGPVPPQDRLHGDLDGDDDVDLTDLAILLANFGL